MRPFRDNTPRARAMTAAATPHARRDIPGTPVLFQTPDAAGPEGLESYRFPSHLPSRTASNAASSIRTPLHSDMQTDHDRPFEHDATSFRNIFAPVRRASSAGRALQLTREENEKLRDLAASLLTDVITAYETHVHVNNRQADPSQWKLVKKRDHLAAYKQKQKGWNKVVTSHANSGDVLPTMMAVGSIAGQLDDILYGLLSESSLEMKLQGSYSSGTVHDAAVLSVLDLATLEEPFQFTGVKWVLQSFGAGGSSSTSKSASAKTLLKRRDLMYLESIGTTPMESGELIGFRILHSVNFKSMAHLNDQAVRAKVSMCQLFRQRSDGKTVDVFMRGYFDPSGGRVSQLLATSVTADMMLQAPGDALECANLKKLTWCAKQSGRRRRKLTAMIRQTRKVSAAEMEEMRAAAQELGLNADGDNDAGSSTTCSLCHKDCSGLLRRSACACMVCSQLVCTRCSVVKKLSFAMGPAVPTNEDDQQGTGEIRQKALSFCLHCIVASNRERAFDVAVSDLIERGVSASSQTASGRFEPVPMSGRATPLPAGRTMSGRARPSSTGLDHRTSHLLPTPVSNRGGGGLMNSGGLGMGMGTGMGMSTMGNGGGRRRATTTSSKRLTTVLTFDGLVTPVPPAAAPSTPAMGVGSRASNGRFGFAGPHRGKAFSVASGATTVPDAEEVD